MDKKLRLSLIFQAAGNAVGFMRGIKGESERAGKALGAARDRLSALQRTTKDISSFRGLESQLDTTRNKLAAAQTEAQRLGRAHAAAERPTKALGRAAQVAAQKVNELQAQELKQVSALQGVRSKLEAAGVSTRNLAGHETRLARETREANSALKTQETRLNDVADRQRKMGQARSQYGRTQQLAGNMQGAGISALGAGAALGAPLVHGVKSAQALETSMTTIAQRSNMSAEATQVFETRLLAAGRAANRTRDESISMFDQLTAQGFSGDQALAMGSDVGKAATAYQTDDTELAATAGSLRNLKLEATQTGAAFDIMAVAGKKGNFEFKDMASAFPALTAGAAAYGMTGLQAVADISAAAQIARRGAGSSEAAATNLQNLLQKIGSPETAKKFAAVGINLRTELEKGKAAGVSALETIIELSKKATGGDASRLGSFFEDAQVQAALRPLMAATDEYRQIRADSLAAKGEVDRDFVERMKNSAQITKGLGIAVGVTDVAIGKSLMPTITEAAKVVTGLANSFNGWAQKNPALAGTLAKVTGVLAIGLLLFGGLALAVSAILGPFALLQLTLASSSIFFAPVIAGLSGMAGAAWGAAAGFVAATWPILLIIAAVALLAGGAYLVWKNWGTLGPMFGRMLSGLGSAAMGAVRGIAGAFMNFTPAGLLIGAFIRAWPALQALGGQFMTLGRHLLSGLINGVLGGIPALVGAVMRAGGAVVTAFKNKLGIHSPSRVFAQLGDYTMQGMGVGIARSTDHPLQRMRQASAALAAAGALASPGMAFADVQTGPALNRAAAPAGSAGQGGAPRTITLNIYPSPGMDVEKLAALVAEKLKAAETGGSSLASYETNDDSWGEA